MYETKYTMRSLFFKGGHQDIKKKLKLKKKKRKS